MTTTADLEATSADCGAGTAFPCIRIALVTALIATL